jgi:large subunit ribosomal protein L24
MKSKIHVKKDDKVYILSGKDRGKIGKVLDVIPDKNKVLVEGINLVTKHKKPKSQTDRGGRFQQENYIHSSNAMFVCNKCDKPTKIKKQILENGEKSRVCKKCDEIIDVIKKEKA